MSDYQKKVKRGHARKKRKLIGTGGYRKLKYGAKRPNKDLSICLHSKSLEFIHPVTKKQLKIEANFPDLKIWNSL